MELITLAVMLCLGQQCEEKAVADSDHVPITELSCNAHAQYGIVQWLALHPNYAGWQVTSWRCVRGKYIPKRSA